MLGNLLLIKLISFFIIIQVIIKIMKSTPYDMLKVYCYTKQELLIGLSSLALNP